MGKTPFVATPWLRGPGWVKVCVGELSLHPINLNKKKLKMRFQNYTMVQQTFQLQVMVLINANPQLAPIYLSQVRHYSRIPTVTDCLVDGADAGDGRRRQKRPRQGDRAVDEGAAAEVEPLRSFLLLVLVLLFCL